MEEFINALKEKNASLNQQAVELRKQNKDDEAVFCTVRANVYDICATVCRVHLEKGNISAVDGIYSRFREEWSASLEAAKRQNHAKKICIEETKLGSACRRLCTLYGGEVRIMDRNNAILVFKCLSDTSRINIISALRSGEAYGELLAQRLGLSASTLSFHMKKLEEAGLVTSRKEQYYTIYTLNEPITQLRLVDLIHSECPEEGDTAQQREDAYRQKVLEAFFDGEQLLSIPVQRKKKLIVLQKIAESFTPGIVYDEAAVIEIIERFHPDYCTLRRDMISEGIFTRENGQYVRMK